jgi:hypothetical protein
MKRFLFIALTILSQNLVGQERHFVLEGSIGSAKVIMELQSYREDNWSGTYFYQTFKKNLYLEGRKDKGRIILNGGNNESDKEQFILVQNSTGFTGTWRGNNKKLPVSLKPISMNDFPHPYKSLAFIRELKIQRPIDYARSSGFRFTPIRQTIEGNCTLTWYREKLTGIVVPRIIKGYNTAAMKRINDALLEFHLTESLEMLTCTSLPGTEYENRINKVYGAENVFSISFIASYYCGGAHPDFSYTHLNFDCASGKKLELDDVAWFGKTKPPSQDHELRSFYRDSVFRVKVVELLTLLYPEEMKSQGEDSCPYNEPSYWHNDSWLFTEKGLYLGAVFPRAARSCDHPDWSIIPYAMLQPYLSPEFRNKLSAE